VGIAERIANIDALMVELDQVDLDRRVLSAPPALVTPDGVLLAMSSMRAMNDHLAEVISAHPDRLVGLATIDAFKGENAAAELERAADELGFRGVVIDSARGDLLLDAPEARPFLTKAAEREIPVFAHPMSPARLSSELRGLGNWGRALARGTASSASLFPLIASGLFDDLRDCASCSLGLVAARFQSPERFQDQNAFGEIRQMVNDGTFTSTQWVLNRVPFATR